MNMIMAFDVVLAVALISLAAAAIFSRVLLRAVILFMVFGLLMAIGWARLRAPDIALTEAALGAGLTGALLLNALRVFKSGPSDPGHPEGAHPGPPPGPEKNTAETL